jgi:two-component system, chemotaxis family, chemotaxis protein CheY
MPNPEEPSADSPTRILVVDDSALVRLYYHNCLTNAGFDVEQAINGIEATEKLVAQTFDLVIIDINMPRMDGIAFLRALRHSELKVATLPAHDGSRRTRHR